jgi:hypothetical protein
VVARDVCGALEADGIGCWIAPRDIPPGQTWSGAILDGIEACRILVVLLSARAIESPEVLREVERASSLRKHLLAVRVENVAPAGDISYFLSSTQWLDAFPPPLQPRLGRLVHATRELLGREVTQAPPAASPPEPDFVEVDLDDFARSPRRPRLLGGLFEGDR